VARVIVLAGWVAVMVAAAAASVALGRWSLAPGGAASVAVGAFVLLRRPGNRVGAALMAFGSASVLSDLSLSHLVSAEMGQAWYDRTAALLAASVFLLVGTMANTLLLIYPSGQAQGWWRWVLRTLLVIGTVGAIGGVIWGARLPLDDLVALLTSDVDSDNPAELAAAVVFVIFFPLALISLGVRYRRAERIERLQIRLLFLAASALLVSAAVQNILDDFDSPIGVISTAFAFTAFPVAIGVAVLRYRLYDIDRIISRTVTYTLVIGVLLAVYTTAVALLTRILPVESDLAVAAATLTAAALFTPLRRRLQRWVDRRFNRTRYVAERELETFTDRLRDTTEIDTVTTDLLAVVHRTLQPSTMGVWIKGHSG
jgi:hypothetical protein